MVTIFVVGTALSGIAESLPENRKQATSVLRFVAVLVLLILVVAPFASLEFIV